ncbi:MAG TPA: hypothetical protein VMY77_08180 [Chitinophagaceae bacterium]|nr:hypothetical protein [Chitinophagaceae bacterium]
MEVHKHPHHVTHKKKWTEYLLEFFMLFLAVFLGFVAENIREHSVEKKRLRDYMQQMIENIKADTSRCKNALVYNVNSSKNLDSLRYEINSAVKGNANTNRMYYLYIVRTVTFSSVHFKQGAITQLKSSGNMRLIENKTLTNEILEYYDRWVVHLMLTRNDVSEELKALNQMTLNFFNLNYFDENIKRDTTFSYSNVDRSDEYFNAALSRIPQLSLLNNNAQDLQKLNNTLADFEETLHGYNSYLRVAQNLGDSLISHIQKEYHLENE